jgi:hypothetical protein
MPALLSILATTYKEMKLDQTLVIDHLALDYKVKVSVKKMNGLQCSMIFTYTGPDAPDGKDYSHVYFVSRADPLPGLCFSMCGNWSGPTHSISFSLLPSFLESVFDRHRCDSLGLLVGCGREGMVTPKP